MTDSDDYDDLARIGERLNSVEEYWRDKQPFLESRGYALRPRLRPGWVPSWRTNGKLPDQCEDFWKLIPHPSLVDATRISDGLLVYIKRVCTGDEEIEIIEYLTRHALLDNSANHCVPILDTFVDDVDPAYSYVVMPFLRLLDKPPFYFVEDVVDFVDQVIEGLVFLHEQGVAHRDCARKNIMMHAASMYPKGFHPLRTNSLPKLEGIAPSITRLGAYPPVRYYYIDFGISVRIPPDVHPKLATGVFGRDRDVPELSMTTPYDPFLVDIFILGNLLKKDIHSKYSNIGFLVPLFESMTQHDPKDRPNAVQALQKWQTIRAGLWLWQRGRRLREHGEGSLGTRIRDIIGFFRLGFALSRRFVLWTAHLWAALTYSTLPTL